MTQPLEFAAQLYRALGDVDVPALAELPRADFNETVSAGMPCAAGDPITGSRAMLEGARGGATQHFDVASKSAEMLPVDIGRMVGLSHDRGKARRSRRCTSEAAFAHGLLIRGAQILPLTQIADGGAWRDAQMPAETAA